MFLYLKHCYFCIVGSDYQEMQELEEQLRAVTDKYKFKRHQVRELTEDVTVRLCCLTVLETNAYVINVVHVTVL